GGIAMQVRQFVLQADLADRMRLVTADGDLHITAAVGDGGGSRCPNRPDDVRGIQRALNGFRPFDGGPQTPLKIDGVSGTLRAAAIRRFQKKYGPGHDGIVDPEGRTIGQLRKGPPAGNPGDAPQEFLALIPRVIGILTAVQAALLAAQSSLTIPGSRLT